MPPVADLLAFEAAWDGRRHGGVKELAIRARLNIPPARYYQLLGRVMDTREALELHPMLVRRLRRSRDAAAARRAQRMAG